MGAEAARPDRAQSLSWDIASEHQPDAYQTYRDSLADLYEVSDVADDGRTGFRSRTTAHMFGASSLARGRSVAQTLTRGPEQIRRSALEHISIIVNLTPTVGECDGQDVRTEGGTVQFRDLARPSSSRVQTIDTINIIMPRTAVPGWLLGRRTHGLTLPASTPGGRLVASHLKTLAEVASALSEAEGVAAMEATFVIAERFLGGGVGTISTTHADAIHRTIRQRAMQIFDARLLDPDLAIEDVARAIGVSRSSLYRAFVTTGGVRTYVQNRRLDRAYVALRLRRNGAPSLAEVAEQHGFSSRVHFSRSFRDRFGFPPGDVAPSSVISRAAAANDATINLDGAVHDVLLDWLRVGGGA